MSYEHSNQFGRRLAEAIGVDYSHVLRLTIDVVPGHGSAAAVTVTYALTTEQAAAVTSIVGEYHLERKAAP